jgi:hypothetical protein
MKILFIFLPIIFLCTNCVARVFTTDDIIRAQMEKSISYGLQISSEVAIFDKNQSIKETVRKCSLTNLVHTYVCSTCHQKWRCSE